MRFFVPMFEIGRWKVFNMRRAHRRYPRADKCRWNAQLRDGNEMVSDLHARTLLGVMVRIARHGQK